MGAFRAIDAQLDAHCPATAHPVERWQAWRITEHQTYPIALDRPETLKEAQDQAVAAVCWNRGEALAIQHSHDGAGKHTLWLYSIKQSTKRGRWRAAHDGGRPVFVGNFEPHLIAKTALAVPFAPVEPFDAFRDDPVGRDLSLVEQ
jgi:hypothetical protein